MSNQPEIDAPLAPFRVLDLTEGGCMIGARFLGDLGADIIKIEPPGGSPSRIAPFYKDVPHPEKSLYWFAYNANKRGTTLDISKADGREIFKKLVQSADAVIESFEPGYMRQLGLGYNDLVKVKPDIIMTSITPFGQNGPKANQKWSDLTAWASGGYLYICGDPDRAPNWISFPQASLHGGMEAAAGTMTALWHRQMTGEGQQVDVSIQECVIACDFNTPEMWDLNQVEFTRFSRGINIGGGRARINHVFKCKDGYLHFIVAGGVPPFTNSMKALVQWMTEEGVAEDWLKAMDWAKDFDASKLTQPEIDRVDRAIAKFVITKTKRELYEEGALKRRITLAPMNNAKDVTEDTQLKSREYWVTMEHPELGDSFAYPGAPVKLSKTPLKYQRRAPLIGEHNLEIYQKELGFPSERLALLKQAGII